MFSEETVRLIREHSYTMEKKGEVTPEVLEIMHNQGLFKLFVPEDLGGRMLPLPEAVRLFADAAWIDGSFGWLVTIGSGGGYFVSSIVPRVSRKLFADDKAVIAGSGTPSGTARRVEGGYRVRGQWKYCSGSTHATIFTANCVVEGDEEDADQQIRSFIFLPQQVEIIKDWHAFGLKATASHSIAAEDVFVPEERTFDLFSDTLYYSDPIYRYPFVPFAETSFAGVAIGIGRHFLEKAEEMVRQKKAFWDTEKYAYVQRQCDTSKQRLSQAAADFYERVDASWEIVVRHQSLPADVKKQVGQQCKKVARTAVSCAQAVFPYLGMDALMENACLNRIWRDLHTACQHTMLVPFSDDA